MQNEQAREHTAADLEQISRAMAAERVWAATVAVAPILSNIYSTKTPSVEPGKSNVSINTEGWAKSAVNLGIAIANAYTQKMQELEAAAMQQAAQL